MSTLTANYDLIKPGVADPSDQDLWGGMLNDDLDDIDALLKIGIDEVTASVAANTVLDETYRNKLVLVDASGGNKTITLPAAATVASGYKVTVKKIDSSSNTVTIDGNAAETVDGAANFVLSDQYQSSAFTSDGTNFQITPRVGANSLTGVTTEGYLHIVDQKAVATSGGTFTSGAWRTRDLNTTRTNTISGASLASNQITLPAGDYEIVASAPAYQCDGHQCRLYNITDASEIILGTNEYSQQTYSGNCRSFVLGRFTLAGVKVLELQHRCQTTAATAGFGISNSWANSIYADVQIWQI